MILNFVGSFLAIGLLLGMVIFFEAGRRLGQARLNSRPEGLEPISKSQDAENIV